MRMMIGWKLSIFLIVVGVIFVDHHVTGNPTVELAKEDCRKRIAECSMSSVNTPVCGSDGVTYSSECQVVTKQCQGESILIKQSGPCPETPPCFSARVTARPGARPDCRPDGTYAPVQCHRNTGYCWCVTPQGRPLPDTSVYNKKPRCDKVVSPTAGFDDAAEGTVKISGSRRDNIRYGQRRRSPNNKHKRQYKSSPHCGQSEKSHFNSNLVRQFQVEYNRTNISSDGARNVERVLSWKFQDLDKDSDGQLNKDEYKRLRKIAKNVIKPKKCAKTFLDTCDFNQDQNLSRQEWGACLANDFTNARREATQVQKTRAADQDVAVKTKIIPPPSASGRDILQTDSTDISNPPEESDANDCISDRKSVMGDQRQNSHENFYVPKCTPDGRYHEIQCFSGYCWCVYQDTGKPIPGTSSKNQSPNCNPVPAPSRPMKGCPEVKKQQFLQDLLGLMEKKMKDSNRDFDETSDRWSTSKEERIASWHFVMLDENKNKVLERKEWKNFRIMVTNEKNLRRCGKKLPKYCDINNDRRISMTEWLNCLNAQRLSLVETEAKPSTTKPVRRLGKNPEEFLQDN